MLASIAKQEGSTLIINGAEGIRALATADRCLRTATSDIASSILRIDDFTKRTDMPLWEELASDYYDVLELSKHSAAKLVAGIKVYLSLHVHSCCADTHALITELDSLIVYTWHIQSMAQHDFNRRSALEDLISRAESLNAEQQRIVEARHTAVTREVEEAEINVNTYQRQLQGLQDRRTLDAEQVSAFTDERRTLEEEIQCLEGGLADAQTRLAKDQACLHGFQSAGWESTRNAMCMVVVYLKTYAEHIGVFAELQKQLWHEVDIYKHALEGVKMFSTSVRRNALQEMQQRVSSTACAWEGVAALIMNEYVK
ncbi:hypothetical protein VTO73DRAFT_10457 [Trametes versicolor]